MSPIRKTGLKDLDFLIPSRGTIRKIPKIMILLDKIDNAIKMTKHLRSWLFECIQNKRDPEDILYIFLANIITISRSKFLVVFRLGNTRI